MIGVMGEVKYKESGYMYEVYEVLKIERIGVG